MKKIDALNFYELLDVASDASPFEVHHAYKEMFQLYHEDSLASYSFFSREEREEILAKLNEAYSILMDEKKRSQYDQLLIERGVLDEEKKYQRERRKLSLLPHPKRPGVDTVLRIRERLKTTASSNAVIQEILSHEALSGSDLKKIRDELGVSLQEIAETVKIRVAYLQAIEEDQFEKVPSRIFLKGFVRAYAQYIGLDADLVANRYLKRINN